MSFIHFTQGISRQCDRVYGNRHWSFQCALRTKEKPRDTVGRYCREHFFLLPSIGCAFIIPLCNQLLENCAQQTKPDPENMMSLYSVQIFLIHIPLGSEYGYVESQYFKEATEKLLSVEMLQLIGNRFQGQKELLWSLHSMPHQKDNFAQCSP